MPLNRYNVAGLKEWPCLSALHKDFQSGDCFWSLNVVFDKGGTI